MKKIVYIILSLFTMSATMNGQDLTSNGQDLTSNSPSLTPRQIHLATCASLEAQGDLARLETAVRQALEDGITVEELKESFSQLYAYTGFPRSLNALGVLKNVLDAMESEGVYPQEGKAWQRPAEWDDAKAAYELGVKNQTRLTGRAFNYTFCPQDDYYLKAHLFGDIFAGDILSPADREIVTVAALSSLKGVAPQLASHKLGAVNMGNTQQQVDDLCKYLSDNGLSQCDAAADACAGDWPKGDPNVNYAQYFTGQSHLAHVHPKNLASDEKTALVCNNVTFEPGCRNNWHIHHGARQILICVSGKGWYQEWGKPAIALKAGDIIDIPEGVKHWHGAQADSWFQHIATHVSTGGEESNEWLEAVSDQDYNKL